VKVVGALVDVIKFVRVSGEDPATMESDRSPTTSLPGVTAAAMTSAPVRIALALPRLSC